MSSFGLIFSVIRINIFGKFLPPFSSKNPVTLNRRIGSFLLLARVRERVLSLDPGLQLGLGLAALEHPAVSVSGGRRRVQEVAVGVHRDPVRAARAAVGRDANRLHVDLRPHGLQHDRRRSLGGGRCRKTFLPERA